MKQKIQEPKINWGGDWTKKKLEAFEKYVEAYLTIMNSQKKKKGNWPVTIYFDGFAGSGKRISEDNSEQENLFPDYFKDKDVYKGSAQRVLSLDKKFDYYYFVDKNSDALNELKVLLSNKGLITENCKFICKDMNDALKDFINQFNKNNVALIFLDPFGMQVKWESIELLKDKRIDLWILIPSGVIINRFLGKDGKIINLKKLMDYFGLSENELRKEFFEKISDQSLFKDEPTERIIKIDNPIKKITEVYIRKLKDIFKFVTQNPLELKNSKNVPIYHLIFASNKEVALKIANHIIGKA